MSKKIAMILSICLIISGLFNANIAYASDENNDTLYGVLAYSGDVVVIYSNNNTHSGTYDRYRVKSTEAWSRENLNKNPNASTPLPPSGPPQVIG